MLLAALLVALQIAAAQPLAVGKMLVATDKSHDPDLAKSVILLIHHDHDGAIGLILNRRVKDVYFGGPIPLGVHTLFRSSAKPEIGQRVFGDVYIAPKKISKGRVYAGYTGWSEVQLQDEVSGGLWRILAGDARMIFDPDPSTLWSRLTR